MKKIVLSTLAFVFATLVFFLLSAVAPSAQAQRPLPPNDLARGLVYDGLAVAADGNCRGGFKVLVPSAQGLREQCTHGPDAAPAQMRVSQSVPLPKLASRAASALACDGDGVSGNRVQVLYARASNVASRYATYLAAFQQWVADVDAEFRNSAAQTGGDRRVRFVTDANCNPVITEVELSTTGDDNFSNMLGELWNKGYNRTDRKYMIFVDARVYCGIGTIEYDDSIGATNRNNTGPHYGRIDAGCWSGVIAAHELMHNLGGVQMSAPHSDGNWHCSDGYDNMCDHGGRPIQIVCPDPSGDSLFDCNHDDYYHTNPPAGSYLATHWNAANNQFLITPNIARVDSFVTGKLNGSTFTPTSAFAPGDTVVLQIHVVDANGANLNGTTVNYTVNQPGGSAQCALSSTTNSSGTAQGTCALPSNAPAGTWSAHIGAVTRAPRGISSLTPVSDVDFTVQGHTPTAVALSSFSASAAREPMPNGGLISGIAGAFAVIGVTMFFGRGKRTR